MFGGRTMVLMLVGAAAVAVSTFKLQQPLVLDLVSTETGLQVMRHEVTLRQWRKCHDARVCNHMAVAGPGAIDESFPATGISWFDAQEFAAWASARSGVTLRLPTVEEWRSFSGIEENPRAKLFSDPRMAWAADYGMNKKVDPTLKQSGGFGLSPQGIADVHGNVWEWTATCVSNGFVKDGINNCPAYKVQGEHEAVISIFVRDATEGGCSTGTPPAHLGLRLVADPG